MKMSFEAMSWAVKQKTANSGQKLVLLLLANHANGYSGQCNPSHKVLAEECCMGISTLKRHIDDLVERQLLIIEHVFTDNRQRPNQYILNMDTSPNRATPPSKSGYPLAQIGLQKQEVKQEHNHNIVRQEDNLFETFWKAYPRKTNKAFARKCFDKAKVSQELLDKMLVAIAKQKKTSQWQMLEYIPHPSSWLNGERWEDEITLPTSTNADYNKLRLL
jgi:hypothetical protein